MRNLKWLLVFVVLAVLIAVFLYLRRDWAVLNAANAYLEDYGLEIVNLHVESLGTNSVRLDHVVIESRNAAQYRLSGLLVVLGTAGAPVRAVVIDDAAVEFGDGGESEPDLAEFVRIVLKLPQILPNTVVQIANLRPAGYPGIANIEWATPEGMQTLSATLGEHQVMLAFEPAEDGSFDSRVSLKAGNDQVFRLDGKLDDRIDEIGVSADFDADIALLMEFASGFIGVPAELPAVDASLRGSASVGLAAELRNWQAEVQPFTVITHMVPLDEQPVDVEGLRCDTGRCEFTASLTDRSLDWAGYVIDSASVSLPIEIAQANGGLSVSVLPSAAGELTGVSTLDLAFEQIRLTSFSGAALEVNETWQTDVDVIGVEIFGFTGAGDLVADLPVFVRDLRIRESAELITGQVSLRPEATLRWGEIRVATPVAEGQFKIGGQRLVSFLTVRDATGGLTVPVALDRDLSSGQGTLSIENAQLDFSRATLSDMFIGWKYPFDVVRGQWRGDLILEWVTDGNVASYSGAFNNLFTALAGNYKDIAFAGAESGFNLLLDSAAGISALPGAFSVDVVDVGLPIDAVSGDYTLDPGDFSVAVENLSAELLGGAVSVDPIVYTAKDGLSDIRLLAQRLQLPLIVELAEFEQIEVTGSVSGELPVVMRDGSVLISNGQFSSDGEGGVIRYGAGRSGLEGAVGGANLGVVTRSLSNFEFDSLTSSVRYDENGDLVLKMRLSGVNPVVDATQPIVLNLSVENNIPQLLRSLQAVRSIEDILEQRSVN